VAPRVAVLVRRGGTPLFAMIPAYPELLGFGTATPDELRAVAKVAY